MSFTRKICFPALLACLICLGAGEIQAEQNMAVSTEVLLKTTSAWDGTAYENYPAGQPELTLVRIIIPAATALDWHTHPMPNAAYVVRGELTVTRMDNGESRTVIGGQTLPELVNIAHRGHSGPDPVELLVFYAGEPGLPLSEPYPAQ